MKIRILVIFGLILMAFQVFAKKYVNIIFYAQSLLEKFKNAPKTVQEKARLLKSIGYDGLDGEVFGYQEFVELKRAFDREELMMPVTYVPLNFEENGKPKKPSYNLTGDAAIALTQSLQTWKG
jgi:hypothetical protein